jgi:DNA/RNA-binding domain of Phe-tRNA-synthetase-like protein
MTKNQFVLDPEILTRIPGIRILLFTLHKVDQSDPVLQSKCQELLKNCWRDCGSLFNSSAYANVQSHPQLVAWRECFKSLGISVKKHVCSAESLAKRAAKDPSPRSINSLVDFYNAISIRHMVPFGAFDLKDLEGQCMSLRFTKEGDTFMPLDGEQAEQLPVGEAAYICEPGTVITRHINYKQSKFALIGDESQDVVMMAELLPSVDDETLDKLISDITEQCKSLFNQEISLKIITTGGEIVSY